MSLNFNALKRPPQKPRPRSTSAFDGVTNVKKKDSSFEDNLEGRLQEELNNQLLLSNQQIKNNLNNKQKRVVNNNEDEYGVIIISTLWESKRYKLTNEPLIVVEHIIPPMIPPPLEINEGEDFESELPITLPDYPELLTPNETDDLTLPQSIRTNFIPLSTNNKSPKSIIMNSNNNIAHLNINNNNTPIETSDFNPNRRRMTNPHLNIHSDFNFNLFIPKQQNDRDSKDHSPMRYNINSNVPSWDVAYSGSSLIQTLPEGELEDEKRNRRKSRSGKKFYCVLDDDVLPSCLPSENNDLINKEEGGGGCSFIEYANKYLIEHQKKKTQFSQLISHSKKLGSSLHNFETKELQKLSLDIFKRIKYYMLDKKSLDKQTNLDPLLVAQQLLDLVFSNSLLYDELYAQLIKQLCNNPSKQSEERGWELLIYTICSFPPHNVELQQSLKMWLIDHALKRKADIAVYCSQCLKRTLSRQSPRKRAPSLLELHYLKEKAPINIRITTFDGTQMVVNIDSSVTTEKVFNHLCDRLKIEYPYRDFFKLFLDGEDKLVELGYMVDVVRQTEIYHHSLHSSHKSDHHHHNNINFKFWFKQKIFLKRKQFISSEVVNRLLFSQMKHDIIAGVIPIKIEKDFIELVALLMQHDSGDFDEKKEKERVEQFFPSKSFIPKNEPLCEKIKSAHFGLMETTKAECCKKFISVLQRNPYFATSFYDIELLNASDFRFNFEMKKLIINEDGIALCSEDLNNIERFKFESISTFITKGDTIAEIITLKFPVTPFRISNKQVTEILKEYNSYISSFIIRSHTAIAIDDHMFENIEENKDLLPFKKGDNIKVYIPNDGNNWEYGECNNRTGNFPANLVQHLWGRAANSSRVILLDKTF